MKRLLALLILLSLAACAGEDAVSPEVVTPSDDGVFLNIAEYVPSIDEEEAPIYAVPDSQARFTSAWAKTDAYFFRAGWRSFSRFPLENIAEVEQIDFYAAHGLEIVGINEQYIFVSRIVQSGTDWRNAHRDIYRICVSTLEATHILSGLHVCAPFFHQSSNSILTVHADFYEGVAYIEAFRLGTGERTVLIEFDSRYFHFSPAWQQMEGNVVVFDGGWGNSVFILVDEELHAKSICEYNIYSPLRWWGWPEVQVGDWIFYACRDVFIQGGRMLRRIHSGETESIPLNEDLWIRDLYSFGDLLFATVFVREDDVASWYDVAMLDMDGNIEMILTTELIGFNTGFTMQRLLDTDIILLLAPKYHFLEYRLIGLFCTATSTFSQ